MNILLVKIPIFMVFLIALIGVIEELYPKPDFSPILPTFINDIMFVDRKSELPHPGRIGVICMVMEYGTTFIWNGDKYLEIRGNGPAPEFKPTTTIFGDVPFISIQTTKELT